MADQIPQEEALRRVAEDEDFVNLSRYGYSLKKLKERYPDECPVEIVSKAMMADPAEIDALFEEAIAILRRTVDSL